MPNARCNDYLRGGDLSFTPQIEDAGGTYSVAGMVADPLQILSAHGMNAVRLRLWHSPAEAYCGLAHTKAMAQRVKDWDMQLLLDIHYSDTWADPGQQTLPAAWSELDFSGLRDSVYQYTFEVMEQFQQNGILPEMVQLGNEINCGMLWPLGAVCGENNTPEQWQQLADLLQAGKEAVEAVSGEDSVTIMIHPAGNMASGGPENFFENLSTTGFDFDVIGLSYYPWWHGQLTDLSTTMGNLAYQYGKPVIVVETSYPWTLNWNDNVNNIIGSEGQLHPGIPATVEGQQLFLEELIERNAAVYNGLGQGFFYWAPDWISVPEAGSAGENIALFDFEGDLLNSISAYEYTPVSFEADRAISTMPRIEIIVFPNPGNAAVTLQVTGVIEAGSILEIYDILGRRLEHIRMNKSAPGNFTHHWNTVRGERGSISSGIYFACYSSGPETISTKFMVNN